MHSIVHTDFISKNAANMAGFMTELFGWSMDPQPVPQGEYILWKTADGNQGGGITNWKEYSEHPSTLAYIEVENITATLAKAEGLGAKVIYPEVPIYDGKMGYLAIFSEPGGCVVGLWAKNPSK